MLWHMLDELRSLEGAADHIGSAIPIALRSRPERRYATSVEHVSAWDVEARQQLAWMIFWSGGNANPPLRREAGIVFEKRRILLV
jgi:hypothetical protein